MDHDERLVGREAELATMERLLGAPARTARALELAGEPGIGKTRLLSELCTRADERGWLVLDGRAAEFERELPFAVFVDAIDDYLGSVNPRRLERLGTEATGHLGAIFPSLHSTAEQRAALQDERYRSHHAVRLLLETLAAGRPLVLALDDIHWADHASVELLSHLLRHRPRTHLLIAFAHRPRQLARDVAPALARAVSGEADVRLELNPLSGVEAEELLGAELAPEARQALYRDSGGNPFYLEQLVRALRRGTAAAELAGAERAGEVPALVTTALGEELAALGELAAAAARSAAVAGDSFQPDLVAEAGGMPEPDTLTAIDELVAADLVRPTLPPGRFRFRHPIVRRAVYEAASPAWRLSSHRRLAEALERRGAPALTRAHHVEISARPGDQAAVELLAEAGHAAAPRAPGAAAHWFAAALRLLPEQGDEGSGRLELLVPMATALGAAGRLEESRAALRETLALLPAELAAVRGRVVAFIAMIEHLLGRHGEASALLRSALAELPAGSSPETAALELELALDCLYAPDYDGMVRFARKAHEGARAVGERPLLASAAGALALAEYNVGRIAAAEAAHAEAGALVDSLPDAELGERIDAFLYLGWSCQSLERFEEGIRCLDRGLEVARATGQGHLVAPMTIGMAICMTWAGRLGEAAGLADETIESARLALSKQTLAWSLTLRCWVATLAGDLAVALRHGEEALEVTGESVRDNYFSALSACYVAETRLEAGDPRRCREELLAGARGSDLPVIELSYRPHFYEILTRAALALDDPEEARQWVERAERCVEGSTLGGRLAEAHLARAALELATADPAQAAAIALAAAGEADGPGDRILAGRARALAGGALARNGERERATAELERALEGLLACGARRYADEAARELRGLGRRVPRRGSGRRGGSGVGALSDRELEVAELVARGMTNKQIAAGLYLSEKTIENHMARIFGKLAVSSRAAVAGEVVGAREDPGS